MLKRLFEEQAELDSRIMADIEITERELYHSRLIALFTEIGEMADSTNDQQEFVKEGVDVLHFIISLALLEGVSHEEITLYEEIYTKDDSFARGQNMASRSLGFVLSATANYANSKEGTWKYWKSAPRREGRVAWHFEKMLNMLVHHMQCHGVAREDFFKAYFVKNAENHLRKQSGY